MLGAAEQRAAFLADAGAVLAGSLDYEETLAALARLVVPQLADWCGIDIAAEERANGVRRLLLEVDEGNAAARRLYAKAGFYEVGRRQGYYSGGSGGAAALVLCRDLA